MDLLVIAIGAVFLAIGVLIATSDRFPSYARENSLLAICDASDAWYREFNINGNTDMCKRLRAYETQLWAEHYRRWLKED